MHVLNQCGGFLLLIHFLTVVQSAKECLLEDFKTSDIFDENLNTNTLKARYASGETVRVHCQIGYTGFFKLICSDDGWSKRGDICRPRSCGHPGDVPFADFELVKGSDYVFGSQVRYTCQKGYQMTSRTSILNCLEGGWDGHLPVCEPIPCPAVTVKDNVIVIGETDQPKSGSVLQFRCRNRGDELEGPARIFCKENGQWSEDPPICRVISCPIPLLDNFQVDNEKPEYKEDDVLRYTCNAGYKKVDGRPSVCQKTGQLAQWTPMPQCEPITCRLSPNPPKGTTYNPAAQTIFRPGQRVWVLCAEKLWVNSTKQKNAQLQCDASGNWEAQPVCQKVRCYKENEPNVYWWQYNYYRYSELDDTVNYACDSNYDKTSNEATCTRDGWTPNPLCRAKRCKKRSYANAEIADLYPEDEYDHNEIVTYKCIYESREFYSLCYYGEWRSSGQPCKKKPCETKPDIPNGDILNGKTSYDDGERLEYQCKGETGTFTATCNSGQWDIRKSCQNIACGKPQIKNADFIDEIKPPFKHDQTVRYKCKIAPEKTYTASCQSGNWIQGFHCPEPSTCEGAEISNGFSHESKHKLYYTCDSGFKLPTKGWWARASCVNGTWKTQDCVAETNCGPVPDINLNVTYLEKTFTNGVMIPIHCETEYQKSHDDLTYLVCKEGTWEPNIKVDMKKICIPIAKKCDPPPQVLDAVILAPYEKKYLSGTVLTYKCRDGYNINGNETVQCYNGKWDQKDIQCIDNPPKPQSD